jgi:hypothetical protein
MFLVCHSTRVRTQNPIFGFGRIADSRIQGEGYIHYTLPLPVCSRFPRDRTSLPSTRLLIPLSNSETPFLSQQHHLMWLLTDPQHIDCSLTLKTWLRRRCFWIYICLQATTPAIFSPFLCHCVKFTSFIIR